MKNDKIHLIRKILILSALAMTISFSSHAQDISGNFQGGSVKIGADTAPCNAGRNGAIRYTSGGTPPWEYCNGSAWVPFEQAASGGLSGPTGCANIGDLCADGTVFAGYHPITQEHLFIPTTDQGTTSAWKTSAGVNDIATDSIDDGRANTNQVVNSTTFPAFKLCKDLTTGGYSDWYLPSQVELYYLWSVRLQIQAAGNITNFQNTHYRPSTEYNTNDAWGQDFAKGSQFNYPKYNAMRVRCVRR